MRLLAKSAPKAPQDRMGLKVNPCLSLMFVWTETTRYSGAEPLLETLFKT